MPLTYGKQVKNIKTVGDLKKALNGLDDADIVLTIFDVPLQITEMLDYDTKEKRYIEVTGFDA